MHNAPLFFCFFSSSFRRLLVVEQSAGLDAFSTNDRQTQRPYGCFRGGSGFALIGDLFADHRFGIGWFVDVHIMILCNIYNRLISLGNEKKKE